MIIAFDWDNTLFRMGADYTIGEPIQSVIDTLKRLYEEGHTIIIWSCRTEDQIEPVLKKYAIPCHQLNQKSLEKADIYQSPTDKIHYDVLIDDKTVNPYGVEDLYDRIMATYDIRNKITTLGGCTIDNHESRRSIRLETQLQELDWKQALATGMIGLSMLGGFDSPEALAKAVGKPAVVRPVKDPDMVAMVIAGEAAGEGAKGMLAVACVVQNRMVGGKTAKSIVAAPAQFSAYADKALMKRNYKDVKDEADKLADQLGTLQDITGGATHYVAKWLYDKALASAEWAKKNNVTWIRNMDKTKVIGKHVFMKEKS